MMHEMFTTACVAVPIYLIFSYVLDKVVTWRRRVLLYRFAVNMLGKEEADEIRAGWPK